MPISPTFSIRNLALDFYRNNKEQSSNQDWARLLKKLSHNCLLITKSVLHE